MSVRGKTSFETYCNSNDKSFLLEEWDYDSNVLLPSEISYGSHKEVSWICKKGHRFKKDIHDDRIGPGNYFKDNDNIKKDEKKNVIMLHVLLLRRLLGFVQKDINIINRLVTELKVKGVHVQYVTIEKHYMDLMIWKHGAKRMIEMKY